MPHPLLASLALVGSLGFAPGAAVAASTDALPSLSEALAEPAAMLPPPQQDFDYGFAPGGWISFGISFVAADINQDTVGSPDEDRPLGADIGLYGWQGEVGMGLEAGVMHSTYQAVGSDSLSNPSEDVDVWRLMAGVRVADRGSGDHILPWLRGGVLYRIDDGSGVGPQGNSLSDNGFGFYLGAGFDLKIVAGLCFTPSVMYQKSSSFDSEEWIGTLALSYLF